MSLLSPQLPTFSTDEVRALLQRHYDVDGDVRPIDGERDLNFGVWVNGTPAFVFKITWLDEAAEVSALQCALMEHLASANLGVRTPRLTRDRDGQRLPRAMVGANEYTLRLVDWIPGTLLHQTARTSAQLRAIGTAVGTLTRALRSFGHPGAYRDFEWTARGTLASAERLSVLSTSERELVERSLASFTRIPLDDLRHSVLHGDLNDWNVLVDSRRPEQVAGIIDFGDSHFGPTIWDLAVACTYGAMGAEAPLLAIGEMVSAYHASFPLEEQELAVLLDLIRGRLCTSLTMAAVRRSVTQNPNPYWFVSENQGWELLKTLSGIRPAHAEGFLRLACGLEAARGSRALVEWLEGRREALEPILDVSLARKACHVVDWSDSADPVVAATIANDTMRADQEYANQRTREGFDVGVGRWGERRAIYAAPAFASRLIKGARRDTHLGLDLFAVAGTPLHTPLRARVIATANVQTPQDYGGVVMLEHQGPDNLLFRTLWGHLDPSSIAHLRPSDSLEAGASFAELGNATVNGGWVPHLHLQLVLTAEDDPADVIGVGESELMGLWESLYPSPYALAGMPSEVTAGGQADRQVLLDVRRKRFASNLSLSYREPLHIVRGRDVWLFDDAGRAFLDCYNNVAHVGHCHPRVVHAIASQAARLNTNTRYLHELIGSYAERLLKTLPPSLEVCFFTNSGSEANELALRLARTHTQRHDIAVLDWAYHGWTPSLVDISPYKYKRTGGAGRPSHVIELPVPDPYRAPADWTPADIGARYASQACDQLDRPIAALIAETIPSCAGQIVIPQGYLASMFHHARHQGGLCILDEVQAGMGRSGAMWAFAEHGVVPDILTLGKPIGNGHPLGAVITTRAVADSFANGMEYFNTFGGNPVSCAAGIAVLDVLDDQRLLRNASDQGQTILGGLRAMQADFETIGDVRGRGLFLGVDLVEDRASRKPATDRARRVANRCKELGVLLGTDGPHDNVIKLRPPMTFSARHVDQLLSTLRQAFEESEAGR